GTRQGSPCPVVLPLPRLDAAGTAACDRGADRRQARHRRRPATAAGRHAGHRAGPVADRRRGGHYSSGGASEPWSPPPSCPATPMPCLKLRPPPSQPATPTSTSISEDSSSPQGQTAATGSGQRSQVFPAATASSITAAIAWLQ